MKAEILPRPSIPHSHFTCELLPQFPLGKCCCYYRISLSLSLFEEKPLLSDFLPDPVVISFSCPVCCRAFISCCVSSFSFSLRAAVLCQPRLRLVFHFPICILSAVGPPLTCGSLFPCSPCVFLAWVRLFTIPRPDQAAWLIALVWSTAVNLYFLIHLSTTFSAFKYLFFFKVSCKIWYILNFSPLALVLPHKLLHFNFPSEMFYQKFPGVPCLYRAGFDLSPAALCVSK